MPNLRRGSSDSSRGEGAPRFCPNCGAANTALSSRCTICGQPFSSEVNVATFWEQTPRRSSDEESITDLYTEESDRYGARGEPSPAAPTTPFTPAVDPWSSAAGRLGGGPGETFVPPGTPPPARREGGPPGFVLGCLGLLLILIVAVATLALVARPFLAERVEDSAGEAIGAALGQATIAPDISAGTVVITESEINRGLRARADEFDPIEEARVQLRRSGIEATFSIYGIEGTLNGALAVENGRIVIRNPELNSPADRLVDVDNVAADAEDALNDLLARNGLRPTAVTTADDTLTITTEPTG